MRLSWEEFDKKNNIDVNNSNNSKKNNINSNISPWEEFDRKHNIKTENSNSEQNKYEKIMSMPKAKGNGRLAERQAYAQNKLQSMSNESNQNNYSGLDRTKDILGGTAKLYLGQMESASSGMNDVINNIDFLDPTGTLKKAGIDINKVKGVQDFKNSLKNNVLVQTYNDTRQKGLNIIENDAKKNLSEGSAQIEESKQDLNGLGKLGVDFASNSLQLGGDALIALLTGGSGLYPMAMRSYGSGINEAKEDGADFEQQQKYALGSAGIEVGTEMLLNVVTPLRMLVGKGAGDDLVEGAIKNITSKIAKTKLGKNIAYNSFKMGAGAIGEGVEEMISEYLSPKLKQIVYDPNADDATWQEILYAGALGGSMGLALGGIGSVIDYNTNKHTNEPIETNSTSENKINNEFNDFVSKLPEDSLTKQKLDKLEKDNVNIDLELKKGLIDMAKKELGISDNFDSETDKLFEAVTNEELQGIMPEYNTDNAIDEEININTLENMDNLQTNKHIVESNDDAVQEDNQIKYGLIDSPSARSLGEKTYNRLNSLGSVLGLEIDIVDGIKSDGTEIAANGLYTNGKVILSTKTKNPILVVAKHEITHAMKDFTPKLYTDYRRYVIKSMMNENYALYEKEINKQKYLYEKNGMYLSNEELMDEIVANATERFLTDENSINELVKADRTLGQKMLDLIRDLIEKVDKAIGTSISDFLNLDQLKEAERLWIKALNDMSNNKDSRKLSDDSKAKFMLDGETETKDTVSNDNKNSIKYQLQDDEQTSVLSERANIAKEQFYAIKGIKLDTSYIKNHANSILNEYDSKYSKSELQSELNSLYHAIANNTLEVEEMYAKTEDIARNIIENSKVLNDSEAKKYKDLLNTVRNTAITVDGAKYADFDRVGGFANFRKRNFNKIKIISKDGMSVDKFYQELIEQYPEFFSENESSASDQLIQIESVIEGLRPIYENPYQVDMNAAIHDLAFNIFESFIDVPEARLTYNEKKDMKISEVRKEYQDIINNIREKQKVNKEKYKQASNERITKILENEKLRRDNLKKTLTNDIEYYKNQVRKVRVHKDIEIDKTKRFYQNRVSQVYEDKKKVDRKNVIQKRANRLLKMIKTPNPKDTNSHVPEELKEPIIALVGQMDWETDRQRETTVLKLRDSKQMLENLYGNDKSDLTFDKASYKYIVDALDMLEGKRINDLSLDELDSLNLVLRRIEFAVKNANEILINGKKEKIKEIGEKALKDIYSDKSTFGYNKNIRKATDQITWSYATPRTVFLRLGSQFENIYKDFRKAQDKATLNIEKVQNYYKDIMNGFEKDRVEWIGKPKEYKLESGLTISMNDAQIMSLYVLLKRKQSLNHIYLGGIKPSKITVKNNLGIETEIVSTKIVKVTQSDVARLIDSLSDTQKKIADSIGKFFNTVCKDWINEVTMQSYGYELARERNYFPIDSDDNYLSDSFDYVPNAYGFSSLGNLKNTVRDASNPIIIDNIFDIFTRHASKTATYNAYFSSVETLKKLMNYKNDFTTIKDGLGAKYGVAAHKYIEQLLKDLQSNGNAMDKSSFIIDNMIRNVKRATLGLNLRSAIQQPTAIVRASAVIDPKYLMKGATQKGNMEEMIKYSPIAKWKSWGYFNIDVGMQMSELVMGKNQKIDLDKVYFLMQKADDITWTKIWNAVKLETKDLHSELEYESEDFMSVVADRFDDIIDQTQVVDTVLYRADAMRQGGSWKSITHFWAEPAKTYNLFMQKIEQCASEKGSKTWKDFINTDIGKNTVNDISRTSAALVSTIVVNAFVTAVMDSYRDDEKEKNFLEKLGNYWFLNSINDMVLLPISKQIANILVGYGVKHIEYRGIEKVVWKFKALVKYIEESKDDKKHTNKLIPLIRETIESVAFCVGVPFENISREISTLLRTLINVMEESGADSDVLETIYDEIFVRKRK